MSDDNPFARLGLQKEIVESLHRQGRLNEFLRTYYRSIQAYVHPDKGGDNALAVAINSAYDAIQRRPGNVDDWVRSMSNGSSSNPEHLAIIEGLAAKVEELQVMEGDYRNLQQQYAELLTSRTGGVKAKVRKAAPRDEWKADDFEEESDRFADIPAVKKPRARRVDAAGAAAKAAAKERIVSEAKPIIIPNLISYDLAGRPLVYNLTLDGEAIRKADDSYFLSSQCGFEECFASEKEGRLPSTRELYALIERLHNTESPSLAGIIRDLREAWLCTGTKIDYSKNIITHPDFEPISCTIPAGDHWLDEIITEKKWRKTFQALFGPKEVDRVPELLQAVSGKRPYIWTPSAESRKANPERAVWLSSYADRFGLDCYNLPISLNGRARRVRIEGAAGAREKI